MRKSLKWTVGALASLAICCGSLAAALYERPIAALADEGAAATPTAYINVGATEAAAASEYYFEPTVATDTSDAGTAGTDEKGLGVFATYRTGASVSVTVEAGEYQVAALVDADGSIAVNGGDGVSADGKRVISTNVNVTETTITVTTPANVKLYAVMVAPKDSKILMHSEWTEGQVVVYGKLLDDELTRGCPAYYSNGAVENAVEYTSIPTGIGDGSTGLNENFNAVTATGKFKATDAAVSRYLIIMPEKLVYFVNAGSRPAGSTGEFGDDSDPYYHYNQTVFDYYRSVGSTLKNDGIPDREISDSQLGDQSQFGHYKNGWNGGEKSAPYPFNTGRVTRLSDHGTSDLGFRLPNVEAGDYKVYIGTMSYWHGRTLGVKINGQSVGNISAPPARVVHSFNVTVASNGTMDIYLTGADTNEALASFVALQKAEDAPAQAAPAAITSEATTVGLEDTTVKVSGVEEGAIVRIYNGARPYNLIHEELATAENFDDKDDYTVDFGEPMAEGVSKVYVIQLTDGGYGDALELAVTDIKVTAKEYSYNGVDFGTDLQYTTSNIVLRITANATSGLDYYEVRKDFGGYEHYDLGSEYEVTLTRNITENGNYEFVFYSMLGVSYTEVVSINHIDRKAPTLSLTPLATGWDGQKYSLRVSVTSVSPVEKYEVIRGGQVKISKSASDLEEGGTLDTFDLDLTEAGEYLVKVTNKAKQVITGSVVVGSKPVYTTVQKMPLGGEAQLTFGCIDGYTLQSLAVYQLFGGSATKLSVLGLDEVAIYNEGNYAAVVKTSAGTTEVFNFEIQNSDFKKANSTASTSKPGTSSAAGSGDGDSYTGTIVTACILGVALIALAVVFFLVGKKKPAPQVSGENRADAITDDVPEDLGKQENVKEESAAEENNAADSETEEPEKTEEKKDDDE